MSRQNFKQVLEQELERIDNAHTSKRRERVISGFTKEASPKAIIAGKEYRIFNSNDYLGLRHHPELKEAEVKAGQQYGTGPGAVRFISGTFALYQELEAKIAAFHGREAGMVFSSAFATNLAVLHALIKGQAADSVVGSETLVLSDALNHRSIIDGIRVANLDKEAKAVFEHMNAADAGRVLAENVGKYKRVVVVSDGVFSMLGEYQDLKALRAVIDSYDDKYPEGVWLVVDDAHGVAAFGPTGRGTEEVSGAKADVLIGTFGKGFGADGGYVVADKIVIDYLREAAATYIYSNSISPGTAGAALAAVSLLDTPKGKELLTASSRNIALLKQQLQEKGFALSADSRHAIQPLLIGDPEKTQKLVQYFFEQGYLVTAISYPVVPKGRDEIRIQISATHTPEDIAAFIQTLSGFTG